MKFFFVAGFDFGTSYSKVVIQDQLTKVQKVVTFGKGYGALFPSYVRIGRDQISGPGGDSGGTLVPYPKLLAADAVTKKPLFRSIATSDGNELMALLGVGDALHFTKLVLVRYFLSVIQGIHDFIAQDDDWDSFDVSVDPLVIQIAVPTGLLDGSDRKSESIIRLCLCAATAYRDQNPRFDPDSSVKDLNGALSMVEAMGEEERVKISTLCITYPEVAAGVQPILQSRNVQDGKYVTLDVGAGTIDMNVFHRWTQSDEHRTLDYWACEVKPLGIARLQEAAGRAGRQGHEITVNPLSESELMSQLQSTVRSLMKKAFQYQPYKSLGSGPSAWSRETFAYIWGGGSEHRAYGDQFLGVMEEFDIGIHQINRLPVPNNDLQLPPGINFGRLAVAYGLSYYHVNLKEVTLPKELTTYGELYPELVAKPPKRSGDCFCRNNPACPVCLGTGIIQNVEMPINLEVIQKTPPNPTQYCPPSLSPADIERSNLKMEEQRVRTIFNLCFFDHRFSKIDHLTLIDQVLAWNKFRHNVTKNFPEKAEHYIELFNYLGTWTPSFVELIGGACEILDDQCTSTALLPDGRKIPVKILCSDPMYLAIKLNSPRRLGNVQILCSIIRDETGRFRVKAVEPLTLR